MNVKVVSKLILYSIALVRTYMKPRAKPPRGEAGKSEAASRR
ncbi:MAG TPA: hypothetical protein VGX48_17495 [Pyrinomonadaceae bacterium]|jgi:hypothetical protein|nr:hypothetical protein [Pyrinomonadaceae bacterium]